MSKILEYINTGINFLKEVKIELKKVTWPGKDEVYGTTVVVLIAVIIFAFYLYLSDMILSKSVNLLFDFFS